MEISPGIKRIEVTQGVTRFFFSTEWRKFQVEKNGNSPLFILFVDGHELVHTMHVLYDLFAENPYGKVNRIFRVNGRVYAERPKVSPFFDVETQGEKEISVS